MNNVRVATFNVENLFARYRFNSNVDPAKAIRDGWKADERYFTIYEEEAKAITAMTIKVLDADIIALQEVENLDTLKRFRNDYLGGRSSFPHAVSIDGNDPRLIDVAILSRYPLVHVRTHQHLWMQSWKSFLFPRDCLEADMLLPDGKTITLYVNHFKSMLDKKNPCKGRRNTMAKRRKQAQTVKEIIVERFGHDCGRHPFVVLGDFNDYLDTDAQGSSGIDELVLWDEVVNVVERLPEKEQWTHFFKGNKKCAIPPSYHQIDYILLSRSIAHINNNAPFIERRGMPKRAERYAGPRFPNVGRDKPKASDHCPIVMELKL